MKKFILSLLGITISLTICCQAPNSFSYQAVLHNTDGTIKANESVSVQIEIIQGSIDGSSEYLEIHNTSTNSTGLIVLEIGAGTTSDDISLIDWSIGPFFLEVTVNGTNLGASQLLSVPYAIHANSAESITGEIDYTETDPTFSSWDKSSGVKITESQILDLKTYLTVETDPLFGASNAANITATDITNLGNLSGINTGDQDLDIYATKDMGNENITNLADPVNGMDAVNKVYVDLLEIKLNMLANSLYSGGVVKDIEGNIYNTITIGSQTWFSENLTTTKYNDGTSIPIVEDQTAWNNLTTPAYCWYNNDQVTYGKYGALYNWYAVNTDKLCPSGWHVPDNNDWMQLIYYLGGLDVAGAKIKMEGLLFWDSPNLEATNETGFSAIPGGWRSDNFYGIGENSSFISSSDLTSFVGVFIAYSYQIRMDYGASGFDGGLSVRCIKN